MATSNLITQTALQDQNSGLPAALAPKVPSLSDVNLAQVYKDADAYATSNPGKTANDYIQLAGNTVGFSQADIDSVLGGYTAANAFNTLDSTSAPVTATAPARSSADLEAIVRNAYGSSLARTPVQSEVNYWVGLANSGLSDQEIVNAFNNSAQEELAGRGASIDIQDPLEMQKPAREQQQSEPTRSKADLEAIVRGAYETGLGRTPAQSEVDYWVGLEDQGLSDEEISAAFQNAAQYELKEREYEQLVLDQYKNIGRTGIGDELSNIGQGEINYWVDQLASGAITPDNLGPSFVNVIAEDRKSVV